MTDFIEAIKLVGTFLLAASAIVFLVKKVFNPGLNIFLFLTAVAIAFLGSPPEDVWRESARTIGELVKLLLLSVLPLFYFSAKRFCGRRIGKGDRVLIAFIVSGLALFVLNIAFDLSAIFDRAFPRLSRSALGRAYALPDMIWIDLNILVFSFAAVRLFRRRRETAESAPAEGDERTFVAWLARWLLATMAVSVTLDGLAPSWDRLVTPVLLSLSVYGLVLLLLVRSPRLLKASALRYARSSLQPGESELIAERLARLLDGERVYRDPDLSLARLATLVKTSSARLSQVINQSSGVNFNRFVNERRLAEAERLLAETDETIADVAFGVGFRSLSSFNTLFRQRTGRTPSERRRLSKS